MLRQCKNIPVKWYIFDVTYTTEVVYSLTLWWFSRICYKINRIPKTHVIIYQLSGILKFSIYLLSGIFLRCHIPVKWYISVPYTTTLWLKNYSGLHPTMPDHGVVHWIFILEFWKCSTPLWGGAGVDTPPHWECQGWAFGGCSTPKRISLLTAIS